MKKEIGITGNAHKLLKKFFFIGRKTDFCHGGGKGVDIADVKDERDVDEYLKNYQSTTRWQTV